MITLTLHVWRSDIQTKYEQDTLTKKITQHI